MFCLFIHIFIIILIILKFYSNNNKHFRFCILQLIKIELDDEIDGEEALGDDELVIHADEEDVIDDSPSDCFPEKCYKRFPWLAGDDDSPFWQGWANLRLKTFQLIENKYFETAVITMILLSSLALVSFNFHFKWENCLY